MLIHVLSIYNMYLIKHQVIGLWIKSPALTHHFNELLIKSDNVAYQEWYANIKSDIPFNHSKYEDDGG